MIFSLHLQPTPGAHILTIRVREGEGSRWRFANKEETLDVQMKIRHLQAPDDHQPLFTGVHYHQAAELRCDMNVSHDLNGRLRNRDNDIVLFLAWILNPKEEAKTEVHELATAS